MNYPDTTTGFMSLLLVNRSPIVLRIVGIIKAIENALLLITLAPNLPDDHSAYGDDRDDAHNGSHGTHCDDGHRDVAVQDHNKILHGG